MAVRQIRKVSLFFQWDNQGGPATSFRVGNQVSSYTLNEATDFARVFDHFVYLKLPKAEVVENIVGTIHSNYGCGYLRVNQGDTDEFVYTIQCATYFTAGQIRTVIMNLGPTLDSEVKFFPPQA